MRCTRSPSNENAEPNTPSASRIARSRMESKTGWTFVGELEIARRISAVAVCCSSDSVSSRFRASSSVNSRTFSTAIAA